MNYDTCDVMKAWQDGLLSHGEALAYLSRWTDEIVANLLVQEAVKGEKMLHDAGVIR